VSVKRDGLRVLVVADSDVRAATIEAALRDETGHEIVVGRPRSLRQLVEEHDPAVVVVAPRGSRVEAMLEPLRDMLHTPPVMAMVEEPRLAWTAGARRAGLQAVLRADAPAEHIVAAVDAVASGLIALDPDAFRPAARAASGESTEDQPLTGRERQILEMLAEGLSNRAVARRLGISPFTVKFHVASILGKLRAASRTEAVTLGVRRGLISL
jgi:NarL family two-component system response regulator YdfI